MEQLVHVSRRFFRATIKPPSQQRNQTPGPGKGASSQFTFLTLRKTFRLLETLLNSAGKVALREIEEIVDSARVDQRAIDLLLVADVSKQLRYRDNSMRLFLGTR